MPAFLFNAINSFLIGLSVAVVAVGVGVGFERWRPARRPAPVGGTKLFNLAAYAPGSLAQALLGPALVVASAQVVTALGGGLIVLPSRGWGLALGAAAYFVAMDFGEYLFHRAQHQIPLLWSMHSFHHSDEDFNTSTTIRHFWFEKLIKSVTIWPAVALVFRPNAPILAIYTLLGLWNYIAHMNVPLSFGRWAMVLNTPHYHRRHHSVRLEDQNCNFAAILPIFDLLSGAYRPPPPGEYCPTGLGDGEPPPTIIDTLVWPIRTLLPGHAAPAS